MKVAQGGAQRNPGTAWCGVCPVLEGRDETHPHTYRDHIVAKWMHHGSAAPPGQLGFWGLIPRVPFAYANFALGYFRSSLREECAP